MTYAENTNVDSAKSRAEIERTLVRYGATSFMYGSGQDFAVVGFEMNGRKVRFQLKLPNRDDRRFTMTPSTNRPRTSTAAAEEYEKAVRQKWRALSLVVKAKLEAVQSGISVFEEEFLANIIMSDGRTVYQHTAEAIEQNYTSGQVVRLLQLEA